MKKIKLLGKFGEGKYVLIDNNEFETLNKFKWWAIKKRHALYAYTDIEGKHIYIHRHILGLKRKDGKIVDHINRNGLDNRKCNLRLVGRSLNGHNRRLQVNNTSSVRGVSLSKGYKNKKWIAQIQIDNKQMNLGRYQTIQEAERAYKEAQKKFLGNL